VDISKTENADVRIAAVQFLSDFKDFDSAGLVEFTFRESLKRQKSPEEYEVQFEVILAWEKMATPDVLNNMQNLLIVNEGNGTISPDILKRYKQAITAIRAKIMRRILELEKSLGPEVEVRGRHTGDGR